jgi:hypothetical protein
VTQYPQKLGMERFQATMTGLLRRVAKLETRTAGIDSGFPLQMATGVIDPGYTSGDPQAYFNGASALSGPYQHLSSYTPTAGDTVLLAPVGVLQAWVILGLLT